MSGCIVLPRFFNDALGGGGVKGIEMLPEYFFFWWN